MAESDETTIASLDRVLTRLSNTDADKLEAVLDKLLPKLIMMLGQSTAVRNKVLQILSHINKRVQGSTGIRLPCPALTDLYLSSESSAFTRNFAVVYLEMGFERLEEVEKGELFPKLVQNVSNLSQSQQAIVFRIILQAIGPYNKRELPTDIKERKSNLANLLNVPGDVDVLLDVFLDVLLTGDENIPRSGPNGEEVGRAALIPAGMSQARFSRLVDPKAKHQVRGDAKSDQQFQICKLLLTEVFQQEDTLCHFVCATLASRHDVVELGETGLKRLHDVDYNQPKLVTRLFALCLGSKEQDRTPAKTQYQIQFVRHLAKSSLAISNIAQSMQMILKFLFPPDTGAAIVPKYVSGLKVAALEYLIVFLKQNVPGIEIGKVVLGSLMRLTVSIPQNQESSFSRLMASDGGPNTGNGGNTTVAAQQQQQLAAIQQRILCYEAMGILAQKLPDLFMESLAPVKALVSALTWEEPELKSSVQGSLSFVAESLSRSSRNNEEALSEIRKLILEQASQPGHQSKLFAAEWSRRLFPFDDSVSRYVSLVLAHDSTLAVRQSAVRGMMPAHFQQQEKEATQGEKYESTQLLQMQAPGNLDVVWLDKEDPDYETVMASKYKHLFPSFNSFAKLILTSVIWTELDEGSDTSPAATKRTRGEAVFHVNSSTMPSLLAFTVACLLNTEGDTNDERMKNVDNELLREFITLLERVLNMQQTGTSVAKLLNLVAMWCLVRLVELKPDYFKQYFFTDSKWLLRWCKADSVATRELVAEIAKYYPRWYSEDLQVPMQCVKELSTVLVDAEANLLLRNTPQFHGAICSLGSLLSAMPRQAEEVLKTVVNLLTDTLELKVQNDVSSNQVQIAALRSLGLIAEQRTLPLPPKAQDENSRLTLIDRLNKIAKKNLGTSSTANTTSDGAAQLRATSQSGNGRIVEEIVDALANIAVGEEDSSVRLEALNGLFEIGPNKFDEVQFAVGSALAKIAQGSWHSNDWKEEALDSIQSLPSLETNPLQHILYSLVQVQSESTNNRTRGSVAIWLICLVKAFGSHVAMDGFVLEVQDTFARLLGEKGEVTQECAAKGIAYLYDRYKDNEVLAPKLVSRLVRMLSVGVTERSILKAEVMPPTPPSGNDATSVEATSASTNTHSSRESRNNEDGETKKAPLRPANRTYKEMCDMAGAIGKQDLVYTFLALSSHHGIWKSRRGGSFDIASLLNREHMVSSLEPYMEKLLPVLFRSRFDSNQSIKSAMTRLWIMIVGEDEKSVVGRNFHSLMKGMVDSLGRSSSRERHSAALALIELLRGRGGMDLVPHLESLWLRTLRAFDDVVDAVRSAANTLMARLIRISIRLCNVNEESNLPVTVETLSILIPILLEKGIVNVSNESKAVSMYCLSEVVKHSGEEIWPYVPQIVDLLIQSLGAFEAGQLRNAGAHTSDRGGKLNLTTEELEKIRVDASRDSMIQEAIDACLLQVQPEPSDRLHDLCARLAYLLRRGVGLPTLVATSKAVYSLVENKALSASSSVSGDTVSKHALLPESSHLLKALATGLKNKSPTIRRSYTSTAARLAKVSKKSAVQDYVVALVDLYNSLGSDEHEIRYGIGFAVKELTDVVPSAILDESLDLLVPLCVLARFDEEAENAAIWADVWTANFGSVDRGVRPQLPAVLNFLLERLDATLWLTKRQSLEALCEVMEALGAAEFGITNVNLVLNKALEMLPGRIWTGKERAMGLLYSCAKVTSTGSTLCEDLTHTFSNLVDALVNECTRSDKEYQRNAFEQLGNLCALVPIDDSAQDVSLRKGFNVCLDAISGKCSSSDYVVLANSLTSMGKCVPHAGESQAEPVNLVIGACHEALTGSPWNVQMAAMICLRHVLERTRGKPVFTDTKMVTSLLKLIVDCLLQNKKPKVLVAAVSALSFAFESGLPPIQMSELEGHERVEETLRGLLVHKDASIAGLAAGAIKKMKQYFSEAKS